MGEYPIGRSFEFRGLYTDLFERHFIRPLDAFEMTWWVRASPTVSAELHEGSEAHQRGARGPVFIRAEGVLSEAGRYGHLGVYPHEVTVTKVLELRVPTDAEMRAVPVVSRETSCLPSRRKPRATIPLSCAIKGRQEGGWPGPAQSQSSPSA